MTGGTLQGIREHPRVLKRIRERHAILRIDGE
jgi:hypothetical protein